MRKVLSIVVWLGVALAGTLHAARIYEETPGGTPDGTLSTFTLAETPVPGSVVVSVNGLGNYQGVDYSVVGASIVFEATSIPQAGWTLRVSYDVPPPPVLISIDAGGSGDQNFSPASTCASNGSCAYTDPKMGSLPFDTLRYGFGMAVLKYDIPAPNGNCDVTLGFSEPNKTAAGQRIFTINANGQIVADVDIFARAGAALTPTTIQLAGVAVTDGFLHLTFTPKPNTWNAFVNSIQASCAPNF